MAKKPTWTTRCVCVSEKGVNCQTVAPRRSVSLSSHWFSLGKRSGRDAGVGAAVTLELPALGKPISDQGSPDWECIRLRLTRTAPMVALLSRYGRGIDLTIPGARLEMEWRANRVSNPGSRRWDIRPSWHGVVYGNGKPGSGSESVIGPEALHAYPISPRTAETKKPDTKKLATHVKFYGSESVADTMG